jgi:phosphoglycolate phosphatase-like HAD superfamily hydrolase
LFGLPEATLFLQLVEHFEQQEKVPYRDYSRVYDDVRRCIDRAHADNTIKREIVGEPDRFLVKDPLLAPMLASFRAQGKKLFLLTNSEPYYTQVVMHHLLHGALEQYAQWREYFDVVIVSAGKPDFYQVDRALQALGAEQCEAAGMPAGIATIHTGGCARLLEEATGHRGDEVLYVGDHTFGDILRAKKRPGWRTAMLVEELKSEIELDRALAPDYHTIDSLLAKRNNTILEMNRVRRRLQQVAHRREVNALEPEDRMRLNEQEAALQTRLHALQEEMQSAGNSLKEGKAHIDRRFNARWGKLFKCGDINSRFGQQVKDFACIYTSAASNFLAYPDNMYFRSTREIMPHEMGMDLF